jgi:hypothetical protein
MSPTLLKLSLAVLVQCINEHSINDGWMVDRQMSGWTDRWVGERTDEWADEWMDKRMDGWVMAEHVDR